MRQVLVAILLVLLVAAAAQAAPTKCGAIVCGTDEGDDLYFTGDTAAVSFFGENGHDTVAGSVFGDQLTGGGGNDELHGGRGDDQLDGGDDSDVLFGGPGNDTLRERRFGFDTLYGGPGEDTLAGGRANDYLYGGTGNDTLYGGSGTDRLYGGPGDDTLYGGPNRDSYDCGPGNDTVYRTRSNTGPSSLERKDSFIPKAASCERIVEGDPTADFPLRNRVGTNGNDVLPGSDADDLLEGKGGSDKLDAGPGNDEVEGDGSSLQGDDTLIGGPGNDRLAGRAGNDRVFGDGTAGDGSAGNDELSGSSGRDLLVGGAGSDVIFGAYDGDRILAGSGNDVVSLLGGDTSDPNSRATVDCGPGLDLVVINPARRGSYVRCELFSDQFHEADWGTLQRPSPEVFASADPAPLSGAAGPPSISYDGSQVAFTSDAPNVVEGDTNAERTDPFIRDFPAGTTVAADPARGDGLAFYGGRFRRGPSGAISADGRFAVFSSRSSDLGGTGSGYRIWRHDTQTGSVIRACPNGNGPAENPVISADGRFTAFESRATNLAGGASNRQTNIYWCDMDTAEVRRVSVPVTDSVNASGTSLEPSISADGRFVAFTTDAPQAAIWRRDMQTGEMLLVDASEGVPEHPRISGDGTYVLFDTPAGVFRKDLASGAMEQVAGEGVASSISADANTVAFTSGGRVMVRNMATGATAEAGQGYAGAVSDDGRYVAFVSQRQVFRRDMATGALDTVSAGIDLEPRTLLSEPSGTLPRRKAKLIAGTTEDDGTVAKVEIAMSHAIGKGRCQWLGRGSRVVKGRCSKPVWLAARVDEGLRFTLRITRLLPRGRWTLRSRATDNTGRREAPARSGVNLMSLRLS